MDTFYVPLLLRLEVESENNIMQSFNEESSDTKPSGQGERTRRRLISTGVRTSPPKAEQSTPTGPTKSTKGKEAAKPPVTHYLGHRTYSQVVVETLERKPLEPTSSVSSVVSGCSDQKELTEQQYFYGNPKYEQTEGLLHLYKYKEEKAKMAECKMLAMMGVPAELTIHEILYFMQSSQDSIERIRVICNSTPNQYMVLIKFKTHEATVDFYEEHNERKFNEMEPFACIMLFVDRIECKSRDEMMQSAETDGAQMTELPTCSVCLERLDDSVIAILCNHTFHLACLQRWNEETPNEVFTCPVCRYMQSPDVVEEQCCEECNNVDDLWICLSCGHVGCGRNADRHAEKHFENTLHTFSKSICTNHVWDYVGDNYVHRLIADEQGKPVEFSGQPKKSKKAEEGAIMDVILSITRELEKQRTYYEKRLADHEQSVSNMEKIAEARITALEDEVKTKDARLQALEESFKKSEESRTAIEKKFGKTSVKVEKLTQKLKDEEEMNQMLRDHQMKLKSKYEEALKDNQKSGEKIKNLEAELNDILMHFEMQNKLSSEIEKLPDEEKEDLKLSVQVPKTPKRRGGHK